MSTSLSHTEVTSQSLIQLHTRYCERKDCLRCRFGYHSMKRRKDT